MALIEALAKRGKVSAQAGAVSVALAGLPVAAILIMVLPAFFILLGTGVYIVFSLMPFILTTLVFFFCYWLGGKLGMPETHKLLVAFAIACLALFLPMIGSLSSVSMGLAAQASAQAGEMVITLTPTFWAIVVGILFAVVLLFGVYFYRTERTLNPLIGAVLGTAISVGVGCAMGANMAQGMVVEPAVGAQFLGGIILWLFGGLIIGAIVAAILGLLIPLILFFVVWWLSGVFIKESGPKLVVRLVFGAIFLFPLYKGVIGLAEVSAMAGAGLPPVPLVILPLAVAAIAMVFYAVRMRK